MFAADMQIAGFDPELKAALDAEYRRQEEHIELIASENYASPRVLEAQGSVLTNKYAEGYPGKRYYGGCEHVDVAETLAIERAKKLFGAAYANVQPHSGSQANAAAWPKARRNPSACAGPRVNTPVSACAKNPRWRPLLRPIIPIAHRRSSPARPGTPSAARYAWRQVGGASG